MIIDTAVQQQLLALRDISKRIRANVLDSGAASMTVSSHQIQIYARGAITEPEEILEFHRQCTDLFDCLLPRLVPVKQ